jgi:glycosyltransferase involved in cell wall biosynthesis
MDSVFAFHSLGALRKNIIRARAAMKGESFGVPYWLEVARREKPVLIHSHFSWMGRASHELKLHLRVPLVMTLYGEDSVKKSSDVETLEVLRRTLGYADEIIAVSQYVCDRASSIMGKGFAAKVVSPGVDTKLFSPGAPRSQDGRLVIGAAGRFDRVKGLGTLLEAFKGLTKSTPNAVLKVAGGGGNDLGLQEQAAKLRIADKVEFVGWVPRSGLPDFYRSLDVFVLPSTIFPNGITEALGMVMIEAQACGIPGVGSDIGGIPETVLPGESALLVPPNDPSALQAALERTAGDRGLMLRLGEAGRRNVLEKFDLAKQTRLLSQAYEDVLGKAG